MCQTIDQADPQSFLGHLAYAAYPDGVYTSLRDGTRRRYAPSGLETTELVARDMPAVLTHVFGADPTLYEEAAEIHRRYRPASL